MRRCPKCGNPGGIINCTVCHAETPAPLSTLFRKADDQRRVKKVQAKVTRAQKSDREREGR